jgi:hypothetical protein
MTARRTVLHCIPELMPWRLGRTALRRLRLLCRKERGQSMRVPKRALEITKAEGASRQVDEAINALERGDFDIAVTLAGAAEGMFERPGPHLWTFIHEKAKATGLEGKVVSDSLNAARSWLKHPTPEAGESLTLERYHAVEMIIRAMSKLSKWSPRMKRFREWVKAWSEDPDAP